MAERKSSIDPAVADILGDLGRKEKERKLPKREQQKKRKERAKAAKRSKALYDLPPDLKDALSELAEREETTASQLAALAIHRLLSDVGNGVLKLEEYKIPSRSPKISWNIKISQNFEKPDR